MIHRKLSEHSTQNISQILANNPIIRYRMVFLLPDILNLMYNSQAFHLVTDKTTDTGSINITVPDYLRRMSTFYP